MDPSVTRRLGKTDVALTQLGLGGASFGDLFELVPDIEAIAAVDAAWSAGVRFYDTAPWYGRGVSELRVGAGLRLRPREEFIVSTKVGRWMRPSSNPNYRDDTWLGGLPHEVVFDYTYDGVHRSVEQSLLRLGLTRFEVAVIHDLDLRNHHNAQALEAHFAQLVTSGFRALAELKAAGTIGAIAAGINFQGLIPRFLDNFDMDAFLVAMPYTLLHQEVLDDDFIAAAERGCGIIVGSPFQSGVLATGAVEGATYNYAPAPPDILERVGKIEAICKRHDVALAAAALQFPLGHPLVASVIPGATRPEHVMRNIEAFTVEIPADFWGELQHERLLHPDAPVPS